MHEDDELIGDEADSAWAEARYFDKAQAATMEAGDGAEDDEEDDPSGVNDEDGLNTIPPGGWKVMWNDGSGCELSDAGECSRQPI